MANTIRFEDLYEQLESDPYYSDEARVDELISTLKEKLLPKGQTFFEERILRNPTPIYPGEEPTYQPKDYYGPQMNLIHVLCGLGGVTVHVAGELFDLSGLFGEAYMKRMGKVGGPLSIHRDELKCKLRELKLPLPTYRFPIELDNTKRWIEFEDKELIEHWDEVIRLGEIEDELNELQQLTATTVTEKKEKRDIIKALNEKRAKILREFRSIADALSMSVDIPSDEIDEETQSAQEIREEQGGQSFTFYREGDYWVIGRKGSPKSFKHRIGFNFIHFLLINPNNEIPVEFLYHLGKNYPLSEIQSVYSKMGRERFDKEHNKRLSRIIREQGVKTLDEKSRGVIKSRIEELEEKRQSMQSSAESDYEEYISAGEEIEKLKDYLREHKTRFSSNAENARTNVQRSIKRALDIIMHEENCPYLKEYLLIRTGGTCSYVCDPSKHINWKILADS